MLLILVDLSFVRFHHFYKGLFTHVNEYHHYRTNNQFTVVHPQDFTEWSNYVIKRYCFYIHGGYTFVFYKLSTFIINSEH